MGAVLIWIEVKWIGRYREKKPDMLCKNGVLVRVFIIVMKHHDQSNWEEKVYVAYGSKSLYLSLKEVLTGT